MYKKSLLLTGLALSTTILLSACSSTGSSPTAYVTPAPPSASVGTSHQGAQQFSDPASRGNNAFGDPTDDVSAPFGLDTSHVTVDQKVKDTFGDQGGTDAANAALGFIQTTASTDVLWKTAGPGVDDYRIAQDFLTPEAWSKLSDAVDAGDPDHLASSLVPGKLAENNFADTAVPQDAVPITLPPQNVTVELVQDESKFNDIISRTKVSADVYSQFILDDGSSTYLVRSITLYLIPLGDGWKIDSWETTTMKEA